MLPIRFFLEYMGLVYMLPVNPEGIEVVVSGNNKTREIIKLGEINILKDKKLKTLTIKSFFPTQDGPYILGNTITFPPSVYQFAFEKIQRDKKPCRLIISGLGLNLLVAIENFTYNFNGGDPDMYYKLDLKEYKPVYSSLLNLAFGTVNNITTLGTNSFNIRTTRLKTNYGVGDIVEFKGKIFSDSNNNTVIAEFNNIKVRILLIHKDSKQKNRYRVETLDKKVIGWVDQTNIKVD